MMAGITFAPDPDAVPFLPEVDLQEIIDEGGCVWPPPGTNVEEVDRAIREAIDSAKRKESRSTSDTT